MACGCNSVPTLGVLQITQAGTVDTLVLDGVLPVSGRFNVRVCGRCLDVCSGNTVQLSDAAGTTITTIIDKCGNAVLLNKVACQARKGMPLHFCRPVENRTMVVLQDKICAPTPLVTAAATAEAGEAESEAATPARARAAKQA